ncbi:patatin-like phospholipase family protein [Asticcacaulis sp. BYS171W]|uniref:Patatin-like phospholipase family protein n=1 Tax=Asticcacaulis aquaticus TaxID=2984212 RepID=A0ABT5HRK7_9CAUL|nr:patatin-like phospholipase family protein [Asticcacaulis aquaticus]MDC7682568.1 patatin-like phospholipase family protein [Asticcacaulis aquaticus]
MHTQVTKPKRDTRDTRGPATAYDQTVLVLQGGGALGSYQGGAYERLQAHGIEPDWVAGVSIGAINAAIIAGNPPEQRAAKLKSFWTQITAAFPSDSFSDLNPWLKAGFRQWSGYMSAINGVPGFFRPAAVSPFFAPWSMPSETSFYDISPLRETLIRHVDFDRLNTGDIRLSVGAVNVLTGNSVYFDTHTTTIAPEHIMASGALPPGFPAVMIDGEPYWDGGVVSNTPLTYVLHEAPAGLDGDTLVFQMDLFSARGEMPKTLDEVYGRVKDITYSSRTRLNTDAFLERYRLRQAIRAMYDHLPPEAREDPAIARCYARAAHFRVSIVHLINSESGDHGQSKDYEFSRVTMNEHWAAGGADAERAMTHRVWREPPPEKDGIRVYDFKHMSAD